MPVPGEASEFPWLHSLIHAKPPGAGLGFFLGDNFGNMERK
jgi:hypothetical protein